MKRKPRAIHIHGRRWFERVNGNTYFSVDVWVDGKHVHRTDYEYGYGTQFEQRATDALEDLGYMPDRPTYQHGGGQPGWQYFDDRGIGWVVEVSDVKRKKDL